MEINGNKWEVIVSLTTLLTCASKAFRDTWGCVVRLKVMIYNFNAPRYGV
jgi:hypothetical protein